MDSDLHRALRLKAAETDRTISDLVNEAVRLRLAEDAEDLFAFEERRAEPNLSFEDVLKESEAACQDIASSLSHRPSRKLSPLAQSGTANELLLSLANSQTTRVHQAVRNSLVRTNIASDKDHTESSTLLKIQISLCM